MPNPFWFNYSARVLGGARGPKTAFSFLPSTNTLFSRFSPREARAETAVLTKPEWLRFGNAM
jgi:hypothetical protein